LFIKLLTSIVLIKLLDPELDPNLNPEPNPNQEQKFRIRQKKLGFGSATLVTPAILNRQSPSPLMILPGGNLFSDREFGWRTEGLRGVHAENKRQKNKDRRRMWTGMFGRNFYPPELVTNDFYGWMRGGWYRILPYDQAVKINFYFFELPVDKLLLPTCSVYLLMEKHPEFFAGILLHSYRHRSYL
jgi:hypothetical protein